MDKGGCCVTMLKIPSQNGLGSKLLSALCRQGIGFKPHLVGSGGDRRGQVLCHHVDKAACWSQKAPQHCTQQRLGVESQILCTQSDAKLRKGLAKCLRFLAENLKAM